MRTLLAALSLTCLSLLPVPAMGSEDGALEVVERSQNELLELLGRDGKPSEIQRQVDALLDYEWIAQSALGGPSHYAERCGERCPEFQALLTELIRTNYLQRLGQRDRVSVVYVAEHVREAATKVDTRVSFADGSGKTKVIDVDYVMHRSGGQWHVRDIITEGVSLAKTYKYDINKLYKDGGIDKVIVTLQAKLDDLNRLH
ncbi:MlaC/ttg2D family ABC transporter substrate-binding protein [Enhygromyxa salina]|uniref:Toluene tolerance, Ttg2 n=1 Tax=Enhygromyxa salina TaxID=215803 RepID=A0A2S9XLE2_9BACT|nr:ABC transporter substrate-binding protein [Enhygromyxa salina]PRP93704.1 Toluene tolerance, Ttg2 [Enhygromyxa salina]